MADTDQAYIRFEPGSPAPEGLIPLCVPEIRGNEWQYIKECLDTNWVSSVGSFVDRFERDLAGYIGRDYAVATINATAALHIALMVSGIRADDEVLVSALTFIAPANAIRYLGAWPVFMDVDPDYWQIDPEKVGDFLKRECRWAKGELRNKITGRRVKAVLPVHILGHSADMDPILEIAAQYNLVVIEDAAESLGAKYKAQRVGAMGDLACLSFNGNKIITTGSGGMLVTDNEGWAQKARYLSTQAKDDVVEYVHNEIGYNYRLTNIQAAMGCAQLEKLDEYVASKRRIAMYYDQNLKNVPGLELPQQAEWATSSYWLYTVRIDKDTYGMDSRELMNHLLGQGVQTRPLWHPVYRLKPYSNCLAYEITVTDLLYYQCLSLPSSVGISQQELDYVITKLTEASPDG